MSETDCIKACLGNHYTNLRCSKCKTQNYHLNYVLRVRDGDMGLEEISDFYPWCGTCDNDTDLEEIPKKKPKTLKIKKKVEIETKVVKWSFDFYSNTCFFCKCHNDGDWTIGEEDAVCLKCSQLWEYDQDDNVYRKKN